MLDSICDTMKEAYKRGWISTRDGNASYRRKGEDYLYVTPSGVKKQHLNSEMIIKLDVKRNEDNTIEYKRVLDEESQKNNAGLKPTGELMMHLLLQNNNLSNRVIIHLHPTYIISAMYAGLNLQELADDFPEINRYTRVGPMVPIIPPITRELAIAVFKNFNLQPNGEIDFDIIGLDRHGIVAIGKDAWGVFEHVERLEHICKIALASGKHLKKLN
jgi:L-fuculose-phosphate aldolase